MKEKAIRVIRFIVILAVLNIIVYKLGETLGGYAFWFLEKHKYNVLIFR